VLEAAVAAMPDPVLGERACAFVMLKPGATLSFEEMIAFLTERKLAIWQLPERLEVVEDMPRSTGGKIAKAKLTEMVTQKLKTEGKLPA
jgi:non-ribosomal peptide synthetase component E (peptide arylation enzyme)